MVLYRDLVTLCKMLNANHHEVTVLVGKWKAHTSLDWWANEMIIYQIPYRTRPEGVSVITLRTAMNGDQQASS